MDFDKGDTLHEWEVPFDWPVDDKGVSLWPEAARAPFDAFHTARQAMQRRMDQSIAEHAEQESLAQVVKTTKTLGVTMLQGPTSSLAR